MSITPIILDVSELEAPEPMRVILTSLSKLQRGHFLLVKHRKEPFPLYPKIIELGFEFVVIDRQQSKTPQYLIAIAATGDIPLVKQQINQY